MNGPHYHRSSSDRHVSILSMQSRLMFATCEGIATATLDYAIWGSVVNDRMPPG
jgi:hypothetical protein